MSFAQFVGSRVVDRRRELQLDKAALARRLGVPETTVAPWEAGAELPSPETLLRLASALRCPVATSSTAQSAAAPSEAIMLQFYGLHGGRTGTCLCFVADAPPEEAS